MTKPLQEQELTHNAILACLLYFDIFNHPLSLKEIHSFLKIKTTILQLNNGINYLINQRQIYNIQGYYALRPTVQLVENRKTYETYAKQFFPLAVKNGNFIQRFPFIKGVFISGSLSKNVMKKEPDIDYFIITADKRVWLAKLLLLVYKLFLSKENRELLCINYFISEHNLVIKEQNTFTATELTTLIPIGSLDLHKKLLAANKWTTHFLPNKKSIFETTQTTSTNLSKPIFSRIIENVLSGILGNWIDKLACQFHLLRNRWKYSDLKTHKDYNLMVRSTVDEIKVHDKNHQMNTLRTYEKGCENLNLIK